MGHLRELFAAPLVGDGLRGDTLLPSDRRRDGTAAAEDGPARFDWDPDKHPRDEGGRWASAGRSERDDPAAPAPPVAPSPTGHAPGAFPAVASYTRGRALTARVAALPHATEAAVAKVAAAKAAFKRWPQENPDGVEYGPEHSALYRAVEAAEREESDARDRDRKAFLAAHGPVQQTAWRPDTSGCKPHGFNKAFFLGALRFVEKLVPESAGADPAVIVRDGRGQFVADLKPSDFEVFEDGVKQELASMELIHGGRAFNLQAPPPPPVPPYEYEANFNFTSAAAAAASAAAASGAPSNAAAAPAATTTAATA